MAEDFAQGDGEDRAEIRDAALVLVADRVRARLFGAHDATAALHERGDWLNPDGRLHEGDLIADSDTGRMAHSYRQGGHSAFGGGTAKEHRAEEFAGLVSDRLAAAVHANGAPHVYLIGEPRFLGLLRARLREPVRKCVVEEIAKSLAEHTAAEIRDYLPKRL